MSQQPPAGEKAVAGQRPTEQPPPTGPENPRHIDARITAISLADLATSLGLPREPDTIADLRAQLTLHPPVWNLADWARGSRDTDAGAEAIRAADALVADGIDVTGAELGRSRRYGFHYLRWLDPLARAYALTGDPRYPQTFSTLIRRWESVRDSLTGEWAGLDVIWYTLGCWCRSTVLLPALAAFADALDDDGWLTTLTTVIGGARWMAEEHTAFRHGNWQLVAATQLLHTGHVLPDLAEAPGWRSRGFQLIREHLALDFYPDGGHYERSPGYHLMCLRNLQLAAAADRQYGTGELAAHPRLHQAHQWIATLVTSAGWAPAFQDSPVEWPGDVLLRGAWLLQDADLLRTARAVLPPALFERELACLPASAASWAQNARTDPPSEAIPGTATNAVALPYSGYTLLHTEPGLRAVINHGPHVEHELESHSHRAVLDLVLDRAGTPLLWEAGGPPHYDDPDYQSWFQAAAGHNAVSREGHPLDTERRATGRHQMGAGFAVFLGSQHGYGLEQRRTVIASSHLGPMLIVRDRAETAPTGQETFTLRWHAPTDWAAGGGHWRTADLLLLTDAPATQTGAHLGDARLPGEYGHADYAPLSSVVLTNTTGNFDTVLLPREPGLEAPELVRSGELLVLRRESVEVTVAEQWVAQHTTDAAGSRALLGWGVQHLDWQELALRATSEVDLTWTSDAAAFTAAVTCGARCTISLGASVTGLHLDGIELEPGRDASGALVLPYAGTWTVTGHHG
ncbi:heparinase II/III family protein [Ruania zhangjianzhongii]|uniref:heparinase II/III family protein n=1 Tax=Ruania zhangjianzhongii TaxID=2603206 RepID=UPI0011C6F94F|nr:heparinase II/III family protein [Ruania zhangjianzhongii]